MEDTYLTISSGKTGEGFYSDKRSRFFAFAHHVESEDEVKQLAASYRRAHHKARHVCYAFSIGIGQEQERANDDGEPSSTAGKPILGQIKKRSLHNVAVFVVRYYGGVNLGTGGLVVAYREAAAAALDQAPTEERLVEEAVTVTFPYSRMNDIMRAVKRYDARISGQDYDAAGHCIYHLMVRKSAAPELRRQVEELLH